MSQIPAGDPTTRLFLRHALATLAYRAGKTVRGTPDAFADYRASDGSPHADVIRAVSKCPPTFGRSFSVTRRTVHPCWPNHQVTIQKAIAAHESDNSRSATALV